MTRVKIFFRFIYNYFKASIKRKQLMHKERIALIECNNDRYKRWIIWGRKGYEVLTSRLLEHNKRLGVFKQNTSAYTLDKIADSIVIYDSTSGRAKIIGKNSNNKPT